MKTNIIQPKKPGIKPENPQTDRISQQIQPSDQIYGYLTHRSSKLSNINLQFNFDVQSKQAQKGLQHKKQDQAL
jgi:hypothetical protein